MMKTRIGILGYGNLGKGVELAARQNDDIELVAIFSRRDPSTITPLTAGVPVFSVDDIEAHTNDVDVLVLGGGSATDLPEQTPKYAKLFNVVDSFDTHANIPQHFGHGLHLFQIAVNIVIPSKLNAVRCQSALDIGI